MSFFIWPCLTLFTLALSGPMTAPTREAEQDMAAYQQQRAAFQHGMASMTKAGTQNLQLHYRTPAEFVKAVPAAALPIGLISMTAKGEFNVLEVRGVSVVLDKMQTMVTAFDVPTTQVTTVAQVSRYDFATDGTWVMEELTSPHISTRNDTRCSTVDTEIDKQGKRTQLTLSFTPHLNLDKTIAFGVNFNRTRFEGGQTNLMDQSFQRTVTPGTSATLGFTASQDRDVQQAVSAGLFPTHLKVPVTVYYLKWSATVQVQSSHDEADEKARVKAGFYSGSCGSRTEHHYTLYGQ